ncbi:MAG TPA: hypothetical protein GXX29_15100 [Firmicutes bacterium]|nr:hypothetical protein [Bacillota bacterium]
MQKLTARLTARLTMGLITLGIILGGQTFGRPVFSHTDSTADFLNRTWRSAAVAVFAEEALVTFPEAASSPAAGGVGWEAAPDSAGSGGYLLSQEPVSGKVTIKSRLRFVPDAGSQHLFLAGISHAADAPPTLLALSLLVSRGWMSPLYTLVVEGDPRLFPDYLPVEYINTRWGRLASYTINRLLNLDTAELEAVLSIDLESGLVVVELSSDGNPSDRPSGNPQGDSHARPPRTKIIHYQGQLYLNPLPVPQVYAGVGAYSDEPVPGEPKWSFQVDQFAWEPAFLRLGLPLPLQKNVFLDYIPADEPTFRVEGVGPGLPGEFRLLADDSRSSETVLWQGRLTAPEEQLTLAQGWPAPGKYEVKLVYVEPDYQVLVARTSIDWRILGQAAEEQEQWQQWPAEERENEKERGRWSVVALDETLQYHNLKVDHKQVIGSISPLLMGVNVIYHLERDAYWRPEMIPAALRPLRMGFIRYPGGEITSVYHWDKPTGRTWQVDPWSPSFDGYYADPAEWMSIDEYMDIVRQVGATPMLGINISSAHKFNRVEEGVAQAEAFLRYCLEKGYNVKHWFLDNEVYLPQSYVTLTAEEYADYINLYSEALKRIDPEIEIIINWRPRWETAWEIILERAGHNIDYIDLHSYWSWGSASFERWLERPLSRSNNLTYESIIAMFKQIFQLRGLDIKVGILEWNVGVGEDARRYVSPYQAGLMNAEFFLQFIRGGLDAAAFWPLHYEGQWRERALLSVSADKVKTMPVYDVFSLYAAVLGDHLVYCSSDQQWNLAFAALNREGDRLTVYVLRKDGQYAPIALNIGDFLKGFDRERESGENGESREREAAAAIKILSYMAPEGDTMAEEAWVRELSWQLRPGTAADETIIEFAVPPYSLTRVVIDLSDVRSSNDNKYGGGEASDGKR